MTSGYVPIPNPDAESGERTHAPAPVWMPRALRRTVLIISLVGISALLGVLYVSSASGSGRNVAAELAAASASATVPDMDTVDAPGALALLRDPTPGATAQRFWRLAEAEIAALGVDTCNNKLGRPLVDAYARHKVQFCGEPFVFAPSETGVHEHWHPTRRAGRRQVDYEESAEHEPESTETEPTEPSVKKEQEYRASVLCMPVQQDDFTRWWPYPTSPCVSRNLQPSRNGEGVGEQFEALCPATREGKQLLEEMGRETFLGNRLDIVDAAQACTERVEHTLLVIHRQDQWNP
jgi:hypothetical protein